MEPTPEINLDRFTGKEGILSEVSLLESKHQPFVVLNASVSHLEKAQTAICALRAAGISCLLTVHGEEVGLEDEELEVIFNFLKNWDQLSLHNLLELCGEWIPEEYRQALAVEAKVELRWMREWQNAIADPRIHKYPNLPWRSFLRKVNSENHAFSKLLIEQASTPATEENKAAFSAHLKKFLEIKKKVVCVFPKNWQGGNA